MLFQLKKYAHESIPGVEKIFHSQKILPKNYHHNFVIPDFVCFGINTKKAFWVVFFGKKIGFKKSTQNLSNKFLAPSLSPQKNHCPFFNFDQDVHV